MNKVLSGVLGIAVAVLLYVVILLGIKVFYPPVEYTDFCNETFYPEYSETAFMDCPDDSTVKECREMESAKMELIKSQNAEREQCQKDFEAAMKKYNGGFFLITAIIGILVLIAAIIILLKSGMVNISSGMMMSAVVLLIYGFITGWMSTNDTMKFIFSLIDFAIIIVLAVYLNKHFSETRK